MNERIHIIVNENVRLSIYVPMNSLMSMTNTIKQKSTISLWIAQKKVNIIMNERVRQCHYTWVD